MVNANKKKKLFVTGASGFIGSNFVKAVTNYHVVCAVRKKQYIEGGDHVIEIGSIQSYSKWKSILGGCDCIVHLAAVAHQNNYSSGASNSAIREVNVFATIALAYAAVDAGVRRFVYVSTIGINGDVTYDVPFSEYVKPAPHSLYAETKYEAENKLFELGKASGMEITVIRPPLVYGPNAPGNFGTLMKILNSRIPLPLGAVHNCRSLVGIDNLVSFIDLCISHPKAANQVFVVSDDEDISTTKLLERLGYYLNKPAVLVSVPSSILMFFAKILGKEKMSRQLLDNLQVDISKAKKILGWTPPVSLEIGLKKTAEWYLYHQ